MKTTRSRELIWLFGILRENWLVCLCISCSAARCAGGVPVYRHADGRDLEELCENIERYRELGIQNNRCQCRGYGGERYGVIPENAPQGAQPGVYLDGARYVRSKPSGCGKSGAIVRYPSRMRPMSISIWQL